MSHRDASFFSFSVFIPSLWFGVCSPLTSVGVGNVCVVPIYSCTSLTDSSLCSPRRASAGAAGAVPEEAAAVLYCL